MAALLHTFSAPGVPISVAEARMSMGPAKKTHIKSILAIQRVREAPVPAAKENLIGAGAYYVARSVADCEGDRP
jgi:hypothetical protein